MIGIICKVFYNSFGEIWNQLKQTTLLSLALVILCSITFNIVEGISYSFMAKKYNKKFTVLQGIGCSYYCAFFKLSTFGTGTAASGMYYMNQYEVPPTKSLGLFTINYTFQKIAVALYCLICFATHFHLMEKLYHEYFGYLIAGVVVTILIVIGLMAVCLWKKFHEFIIFLSNKFVHREKIAKKLTGMKDWLESIRNATKDLLEDKKILIKLLLFNMMKFTGWYLIPCCVLGYTKISDILLIVSISALASALIGVIPMPGAVGSTEAMFVILFTAVVGKVKAAAIMLIYRCFTYIFPFAVGAVFILIRKLLMKETEQLKTNEN